MGRGVVAEDGEVSGPSKGNRKCKRHNVKEKFMVVLRIPVVKCLDVIEQRLQAKSGLKDKDGRGGKRQTQKSLSYYVNMFAFLPKVMWDLGEVLNRGIK